MAGVKGSTGEIAVGNKEGTGKTRTVQRKPDEMRWSSENSDVVKGVPWSTSDGDPNADGEAMKGKVIDLRNGEALRTSGRR